MSGYSTPVDEADARERINYARRFIDERDSRVGRDEADNDFVCVSVLRDVIDGYEYLVDKGK